MKVLYKGELYDKANASVRRIKIWVNKYYDRLKNGEPIRTVRDAYYGDKKAHEQLDISVSRLDTIWEKIMDKRYIPVVDVKTFGVRRKNILRVKLYDANGKFIYCPNHIVAANVLNVDPTKLKKAIEISSYRFKACYEDDMVPEEVYKESTLRFKKSDTTFTDSQW